MRGSFPDDAFGSAVPVQFDVVGGAAAGGYYAGKDERSAERIAAERGYAPLALMGSELPFPFELATSRLPAPGLPSGATAAMPLLESLAGEERRLKVLTASQDVGAPEKILPYFEKEQFLRIEPWLDKEGTLGFHFGGGLPVSVLYDANGKEVWRVTGDLDWADPEVRGAIGEALPAA